MITADHVATAIVTASKAVGVDPLEVPTNNNDPNALKRRLLFRARAYAAIALSRTCPSRQKQSIGRMVGSRTPTVFMAQTAADLRDGRLKKWWQDWIIEAVVKAINEVPEPVVEDEPEEVPVFLAPRPLVSRSAGPGKKALYDMLREAVLNTVADSAPKG